MYITGHESILDDTLESIMGTYFDQSILDNNVNYHKLKKGMIYPDLPCGKYELIKTTKDVFSIMKKKTVCNITRLHKIMGQLDNLKEIFQSHRGIYAFLHSMSYSSVLTSKQIRDTILSHIAAYSLLSIYDKQYYSENNQPSPSIFWIGIILHIISDSYSQSHTIRLIKKTKIVKEEKKPLDPYVKFRMKLWETIFKQANDSKKHTIDNEDELQEALLKQFKQGSIEYTYISRKKSRLFKAYKMFLFDIQTKKVVNNFIKTKWLDYVAPSYEEYDIINYQYYNNQTSMYHKKRDFLTHVKKYKGLYERMISECKTVLLLYKKCLEDIKNNPSKHQIIAKKFVKDLGVFLSSHTFRMTKQNLNKKTGVIYKKKTNEKK